MSEPMFLTMFKRDVQINKRLQELNDENTCWRIAFFIGLILIAMAFALCALAVSAHSAEVLADLDAVMQIESSGCHPGEKYGRSEHARGCFQITPAALSDFNRYTSGQDYTMDDMLDDKINMKVADWYINTRIPAMLKSYGIPDSGEMRYMAYNRGIGSVNKWFKSGADESKIPALAKRNLNKYRKLTK